MSLRARRKPQRQAGYSYVEILIATILIAVSMVPIMDALRNASVGAGIYESYSAQHYSLLAKMEEVLAEPYDSLDAEAAAVGNSTTPTAYSDLASTPERRLVYLAAYDIDNADGDNEPFLTGTDPGVLWVRVEIEGTALSTESLTTL